MSKPNEDGTQVFAAIYRDHVWTGTSRSGPGSDPERTVEYRRLLTRVMRENGVRSVVDLGCGDWASSRLISWEGIDYLGVDAVADAVASNRLRFSRPGVRFEQADIVSDDLPVADLVIIKEVLQHLPNESVAAVLRKLHHYRWAILVNDIKYLVRDNWSRFWKWIPWGHLNTDIKPGDWRPLALREPPFSLDAECLGTYVNKHQNKKWIKEVLLWTNRQARPVVNP